MTVYKCINNETYRRYLLLNNKIIAYFLFRGTTKVEEPPVARASCNAHCYT